MSRSARRRVGRRARRDLESIPPVVLERNNALIVTIAPNRELAAKFRGADWRGLAIWTDDIRNDRVIARQERQGLNDDLDGKRVARMTQALRYWMRLGLMND